MSQTVKYDPADPFHSWVDFLLMLSCCDCQRDFELPDMGKTKESFYQWCADTSERAKAAGWVMIDERPYCPECAAKQRS
jgi:hypothetical protein